MAASRLAQREQRAAEARHGAEHRKRTNAAKPGAWSVGVTRPLALEPDGHAAQRCDEQPDVVDSENHVRRNEKGGSCQTRPAPEATRSDRWCRAHTA